MTKEIETGGPAFPAAFTSHQPGMTLRDYFAAQAMTAVIADRLETRNPPQDMSHAEAIAYDCYILAEAMLEAREK